MPKYLFTSDQRISELPYRIKKWASFIQEGHDISEITDKSDNNNATTLRFYYNLFAGTETCLKSAEDPIWGIRNFVLKFQFPNVRTPESLYDSLSEKILFAPYRSVVTVLYRMAQLNENTVSYLNKYEILYYLFCNPEVYKNPIVDYDSVINDLLLGREKRIDLTNPISSVLEWKQYDRQAREMLNVLSYASSCFKLSKDTISFSLNSEQYKIDKEYIDQILGYSKIWFPSNPSDFTLSTLEYISYMDTYNTPYNVINLKLETPTKKTFSEKRTLQQIFYGAPGTGKSDGVKKLTEAGGMFHKDYIYRTTFHPDSDYSTFVGAYKPVWDDIKGKIVYEFRPQTFLKAYIAAWTHPDKNVALVIEEINRGNCAQIFGDVFQLLDRENDGLSKYPIESDVDMQGFIKKAFSGEIEADWAGTIEENDGNVINDYYSKHYDGAFEKIKNGEILALPKNLSILATMNTSDQSLFPMDSAFKRRWEWIYKPIVNAGLNWKIKLDDKYEPIDWWEFLDRINKVISGLTTSKDKKLGYFFCCPDEKKSDDDSELSAISAKLFVGKVIFYLWNDVFKDYAFDADCCKDEKGEEVMYSDFYKKDRTEINIDVLKRFFDELKEENEDSLVIEKKKEDVPSEDDDDSIEE